MSPDGKLLATGCSDGTIKTWNVADGTVVHQLVNPGLKPRAAPLPSHPGRVYGVRFTPDGKHLVGAGGAPGGKGSVAVWTVSDGKLLMSQEVPGGTCYGLALSPDGKKITALGMGEVRFGGDEVNRSYVIKMPEIK